MIIKSNKKTILRLNGKNYNKAEFLKGVFFYSKLIENYQSILIFLENEIEIFYILLAGFINNKDIYLVDVKKKYDLIFHSSKFPDVKGIKMNIKGINISDDFVDKIEFKGGNLKINTANNRCLNITFEEIKKRINVFNENFVFSGIIGNSLSIRKIESIILFFICLQKDLKLDFDQRKFENNIFFSTTFNVKKLLKNEKKQGFFEKIHDFFKSRNKIFLFGDVVDKYLKERLINFNSDFFDIYSISEIGLVAVNRKIVSNIEYVFFGEYFCIKNDKVLNTEDKMTIENDRIIFVNEFQKELESYIFFQFDEINDVMVNDQKISVQFNENYIFNKNIYVVKKEIKSKIEELIIEKFQKCHYIIEIIGKYIERDFNGRVLKEVFFDKIYSETEIKIQEYFRENVGIENINTKENLRIDLEIDSLSILEMLFWIEEKFGCRISMSKIKNVTTINQLAQLIDSQQKINDNELENFVNFSLSKKNNPPILNSTISKLTDFLINKIIQIEEINKIEEQSKNIFISDNFTEQIVLSFLSKYPNLFCCIPDKSINSILKFINQERIVKFELNKVCIEKIISIAQNGFNILIFFDKNDSNYAVYKLCHILYSELKYNIVPVIIENNSAKWISEVKVKYCNNIDMNLIKSSDEFFERVFDFDNLLLKYNNEI